MAKTYYEMSNVGSSKYLVNHHDGVQTHNDGSPFFGLSIFKNKKKKIAFIKDLVKQGYTERQFSLEAV